MNIEIRTDKNIQNSERLITYVREELLQEFQRFDELITNISVHISDENGTTKGGDEDIRSMIEIKAANLNPVVGTFKARNIDLSIHGAIERAKRSLEHIIDRNRSLEYEKERQDKARHESPDDGLLERADEG